VREESVSRPAFAKALRERLAWDPALGRISDGPRRYLLMRPDVLMGAVEAMAPAHRGSFLSSWQMSTCQHGADSLRAYAQMVQGDRHALLQATVAAAADLGWGRWALTLEDGLLHLEVLDSPFVAGWLAASQGRPSEEPVCAPIRGMLQALAEVVLEGPVAVQEDDCAALQAQASCPSEVPATSGDDGGQAHGAPCTCRFTARARSAA
jgi:hypothetical protein